MVKLKTLISTLSLFVVVSFHHRDQPSVLGIAIKQRDDDDYDFYGDAKKMDENIAHLSETGSSTVERTNGPQPMVNPVSEPSEAAAEEKQASKEEGQQQEKAPTQSSQKQQGTKSAAKTAEKEKKTDTQSEANNDKNGEEQEDNNQMFFKTSKKAAPPSKQQLTDVKQTTLINKLIPIVYDEKSASPKISSQERQVMKGNIELNVFEEPMEHFTTEDDTYLKKLVEEKKRGESYQAVVVKDDMMTICTDVMAHWFNIKGQDNQNYMNRFFFDKWKAMDNSGKGEIAIDESVKFIRDYISGVVQV